ncbi:MAG: hypothetical protein AAFN74_21550, partial [Myxococcota bacterium]
MTVNTTPFRVTSRPPATVRARYVATDHRIKPKALKTEDTPTTYDIDHPSDFHWVTGLMAGISAIAGVVGVGLLISRDPEPRLEDGREPLAIGGEPFSGELLAIGGFGV